jgi:hypothetical protein
MSSNVNTPLVPPKGAVSWERFFLKNRKGREASKKKSSFVDLLIF